MHIKLVMKLLYHIYMYCYSRLPYNNCNNKKVDKYKQQKMTLNTKQK